MSEPTTFEEWLKQNNHRWEDRHAIQIGWDARTAALQRAYDTINAQTAQLADARAEIERLKAQLRTSSVHDELAQLTAEIRKLSAVVERESWWA